MPTLSLPDGSVLAWGETPALPEPVPAPEEPLAMTASEASPEEVKAALATMPPKWRATAMRFVKSLVATVTATLAVYGGDLAGVVRDPRAFLVALASSTILALQKWATWKDE